MKERKREIRLDIVFYCSVSNKRERERKKKGVILMDIWIINGKNTRIYKNACYENISRALIIVRSGWNISVYFHLSMCQARVQRICEYMYTRFVFNRQFRNSVDENLLSDLGKFLYEFYLIL